MKWNYRLILMDVSSPDEPWYEMREVFYDGKGKPKLWTQEAACATGESPSDVLSTLLLMAVDADRLPALKESEMPRASKNTTNNRGDGE